MSCREGRRSCDKSVYFVKRVTEAYKPTVCCVDKV